MEIVEYNDFYNDGFGYVCKHCERELEIENSHQRSRLMCEGEAESKQPVFSTAIARWLDKAQTTLICPRCGIVEKIE